MSEYDPYVELFNVEEFAGIKLNDPYYKYFLQQFNRDPFYKDDTHLFPYILTQVFLKAEIHNHSAPLGWDISVYNGNALVYKFKNTSQTFDVPIDCRLGDNAIKLVCIDKTTNKIYETAIAYFTTVNYLLPSLPFLSELIRNRYHIDKLVNWSITNEKLNSLEIEETWGKLGARNDISKSDAWDSEITYRLKVRKYLQGIYGKKDKKSGLSDTLSSLFGITPMIIDQKDTRFQFGFIEGNTTTSWRNSDYSHMGKIAIGQMPLRSEAVINNGFDVVIWGESDRSIIKDKLDSITPIYTDYGIKIGSDYISYALSKPLDERFSFENGVAFIDRFNVVERRDRLNKRLVYIIEDTIPFVVGENIRIGSNVYEVNFIDENDHEIGLVDPIEEAIDGIKIGSAEEIIYESEICQVPDDSSVWYGDLNLFQFNQTEVDLQIKTAKSTSIIQTTPYVPFKPNDLVAYGAINELIDWETTGPSWTSGRTYSFNATTGKYIFKEFNENLSFYGITQLRLSVSCLQGDNLLFFGMGTQKYSNYEDIEYLWPISNTTGGTEEKIFDLSVIDPKHYNRIKYLYLIQGTSGISFNVSFSKITTDKSMAFFQWKAIIKNVVQKYDFAMSDFILKKI